MIRFNALLSALLALVSVVGCAATPQTRGARAELVRFPSANVVVERDDLNAVDVTAYDSNGTELARMFVGTSGIARVYRETSEELLRLRGAQSAVSYAEALCRATNVCGLELSNEESDVGGARAAASEGECEWVGIEYGDPMFVCWHTCEAVGDFDVCRGKQLSAVGRGRVENPRLAREPSDTNDE